MAGFNNHRDFIYKKEDGYPTFATESVLLTCIVDAEEHQDVATVEIPNAFIHNRIKDKKGIVIIKIGGVLVDIILEIAPDIYVPSVIMDRKGVKKIIVQCQNTTHGTMV